MKSFISIIFFSLISFIAFSQCNTSILDRKGDVTVFGAGLENLYSYVGFNDNGDYGQGVYMINGHLIRFKASSNGISLNEWQLIITVKAIYFKPLVPRKVRINFSDGSILNLSAVAFRQAEGHQICEFDINEFDIKKFDKGILKMTVIDHRQNTEISKKPNYANVFKEQKMCLNQL